MTTKVHLSGDNAFYKSPTYIEDTERELSSSTPIQTPVYVYNSNNYPEIIRQIIRISDSVIHGLELACPIIVSLPIAISILPAAIFALGFLSIYSKIDYESDYKTKIPLFILAGLTILSALPALPLLIFYIPFIERCIIHPSSIFLFRKFSEKESLQKLRCNFFENHPGFEFKRITIEVNKAKIDAIIIGQQSTLSNGRWVVESGGNSEFYERHASSEKFYEHLRKANCNAIIYNPQATGSSTGWSSAKNLAKSFKAVLSYTEDKEGLGATEIVGYGFSLGGGIQGEALKTHTLKKTIKYSFAKIQTFSSLSAIAKTKHLSFFPIFWGNLDSLESSRKLSRLKVPEFIVQSAHVNCGKLYPIDYIGRVCDDGTISKEASLAFATFDEPSDTRQLFGIRGFHGDGFYPLEDLFRQAAYPSEIYS